MADRLEYLFLCHGGAKRSPTALNVAREIASQRQLSINMEYGSSDAINASNQGFMAKHLSRYRKIIVMTEDISKKLEELGLDSSKIFCLNIPDNYERDDPQLRKLFKEKLSKIIS